MSDTTSVMNTPSTDQIKALQTLEQSIRKLLNSFGVDGAALPAKKKRASKKAAAEASASDGEPSKPKREINPKIAAMNEERKTIFAEMKDAWTKANPSFATMSKDELKKAITEGKVSKPPGYPDALKEHSKRMGEKDPEHAKRAAERRKAADDKKSQKSDAASEASAKLNDAASDASATKKKRGPKKLADMTPEERAAHEAKKAAKKAAKDGAPAPALPSASLAAPAATVEVITGEDDDPETLVPWSFQNKNYFKNELGFVYEMVSPTEPGAYVGRVGLVKGKRGIDTSIPEPEDD